MPTEDNSLSEREKKLKRAMDDEVQPRIYILKRKRSQISDEEEIYMCWEKEETF